MCENLRQPDRGLQDTRREHAQGWPTVLRAVAAACLGKVAISSSMHPRHGQTSGFTHTRVWQRTQTTGPALTCTAGALKLLAPDVPSAAGLQGARKNLLRRRWLVLQTLPVSLSTVYVPAKRWCFLHLLALLGKSKVAVKADSCIMMLALRSTFHAAACSALLQEALISAARFAH